MKLAEQTVKSLKETMLELGIPDTLENRDQFVETILQIGISSVMFSSGVVEGFSQRFPASRLVPSVEETPQPAIANNNVCSDCEVPIVVRGDGKRVCNCRVWS